MYFSWYLLFESPLMHESVNVGIMVSYSTTLFLTIKSSTCFVVHPCLLDANSFFISYNTSPDISVEVFRFLFCPLSLLILLPCTSLTSQMPMFYFCEDLLLPVQESVCHMLLLKQIAFFPLH